MTLLRNILLAAVVGGALAGVLMTGLQALRLVPLILTAEHYERHGAAAGTPTPGRPGPITRVGRPGPAPRRRRTTRKNGRPRLRCNELWRPRSPIS